MPFCNYCFLLEWFNSLGSCHGLAKTALVCTILFFEFSIIYKTRSWCWCFFVVCRICMHSYCLLLCPLHQCQEWVVQGWAVVLLLHHQWAGWECLQCHHSACHQWAPIDLWLSWIGDCGKPSNGAGNFLEFPRRAEGEVKLLWWPGEWNPAEFSCRIVDKLS